MPNTTESQINMTPEEAKASLGIATHLQDQLMPRQMQEMAPQEAQNTQQPQDTITPRIDELEAKFSEFQKEVKTTIQDEIGGLKKDITNALSEDEQKD